MSGSDVTATGFGLGLILAMEVPNLYSAPLPSKFTIATFCGGDEAKVIHTKKWIRSGEIEATIQAVLLGLGGTVVTKSPYPLLMVLGMIAWKTYSYESALRGGISDGLKMDMAGQG